MAPGRTTNHLKVFSYRKIHYHLINNFTNKSTYITLGLKMYWNPCGPSSVPTNNTTTWQKIFWNYAVWKVQGTELLLNTWQILTRSEHSLNLWNQNFPNVRNQFSRVHTVESNYSKNRLNINSDSREKCILLSFWNQITVKLCILSFVLQFLPSHLYWLNHSNQVRWELIKMLLSGIRNAVDVVI